MRLLPLRIGVGNQRAGFAQSKAPLPEQALALPDPQVDLETLSIQALKVFPVPQRAVQPPIARRLAQCPSTSRICASLSRRGRPERWPSVNPAKPSASKRRTQILDGVREHSPGKRPTSGHVAPWATKRTPWRR